MGDIGRVLSWWTPHDDADQLTTGQYGAGFASESPQGAVGASEQIPKPELDTKPEHDLDAAVGLADTLAGQMNMLGQPSIFAAAIAVVAWAGAVALLEVCLFVILFWWAGPETDGASAVFAFASCIFVLPLVFVATVPIGVFAYRRTILMVDSQGSSDQAESD